MLVGLADGYDYIDSEPEVRCAILTGAGGNFSSGADLKAMAKPSEDERVRTRMSDSPGNHWKALLRDYRLSKPLIAAVEGYAVAGGTEMLQGTDIRIARRDRDLRRVGGEARALPARRLGVRLPRQIPYTQAMDILLTSRAVSAHEALQIGLIGRVAPEGQALPVARVVADAGRGERAALDAGDPAGVARGRGRARRGGDADPGRDRLGGLRQRGRPGGPARVRGEARTPSYQGEVGERAAAGSRRRSRHRSGSGSPTPSAT